MTSYCVGCGATLVFQVHPLDTWFIMMAPFLCEEIFILSYCVFSLHHKAGPENSSTFDLSCGPLFDCVKGYSGICIKSKKIPFFNLNCSNWNCNKL